MAVLSTDVFMERINSLIGENSDDDTLAMLGDFKDTLDANANANTKIAELEQKNKDLDTSWRKKYRDRFFTGGTDSEDFGVDLSEQDGSERKTFESLFSTGGK